MMRLRFSSNRRNLSRGDRDGEDCRTVREELGDGVRLRDWSRGRTCFISSFVRGMTVSGVAAFGRGPFATGISDS